MDQIVLKIARLAVCLTAAVSLTACMTTAMNKMTPEGKAFYEKAKVHPTSFMISKDQGADVWGRAQSFISEHSSVKLQTTTDYVIETYNPQYGYGYKVTKAPSGQEFKITVNCLSGDFLNHLRAEDNAHILAHYLKTGELPPDGVVNMSVMP